MSVPNLDVMHSLLNQLIIFNRKCFKITQEAIKEKGTVLVLFALFCVIFFKISGQREIHSTMILSDCNFRLLKPSKQLYDFLGVYIQSVSEDFLFSF